MIHWQQRFLVSCNVQAFLFLILIALSGIVRAELTASITLASGSPTAIYPTQETALSITLTNSGSGDATSTAFSLTLPGTWPAGLRVSSAATYSCTNDQGSVTPSGSVTATVGTNSVSLANGVVPRRANNVDGYCTIIVPVTVGDDTLSSYATTIASGDVTGLESGSAISNSGNVSQTINVVSLSTYSVQETYSSSSVYQLDEPTLTITVTNPNPVPIRNFSITDTFNVAGHVEVASTPAATASCNNSGGSAAFSPAAGDSSLSFSGTLPAKSGSTDGKCTFTVKLKAIGVNSANYVTTANTLSGGTNDLNLTPNLYPANLTINAGVEVSETLLSSYNSQPTANPIYAGDWYPLTLTISNKNSVEDLTNVSVALPDHLRLGTSYYNSYVSDSSTVARGLAFRNIATTCASGTASISGTTIQLSGATIAKNSSCTITAEYSAYTRAGISIDSYYYGVIPAQAVTADQAIYSKSSKTSHYLRIDTPLTVVQGFQNAAGTTLPSGSSMLAGDQGKLFVQISNASSTDISITSFSKDPIDGTGSGLNITSVTNTCGGTSAPTAGGYGFTLSGGTVPSTSNCTVTSIFTSQLPSSTGTATYTNTIANSAIVTTDGLHVSDSAASGNLVVRSPLQVEVSYALTSAPSTDITTLTAGVSGRLKLLLKNASSVSNISAVQLSLANILQDSSNSAAVGLTISSLDASDCTGASATNTTTGLSLSGISLNSSSQCSVNIDFTASPKAGENSTDYDTEILSSGSQGANAVLTGTLGGQVILGSGTTEVLTVTDPIRLSKSQEPHYYYDNRYSGSYYMAPGNPINYTLKVDNYNSSNALSNVQVTDSLPSGITFLTGVINGHDFTPTVDEAACGSVSTTSTTGSASAVMTIQNIDVAPSGSYSRCTLSFWGMLSSTASSTGLTGDSDFDNIVSTGDVCSDSGLGVCNGGSATSRATMVTSSPLSLSTSAYNYSTSDNSYTSSPYGSGYSGNPMRLRYYIRNATLNSISNVSFASSLPTSTNPTGEQLKVAFPANFSTNCGTANSGEIPQPDDTAISLTNLTIPARPDSGTGDPASCYVQFDVVGNVGTYATAATVANINSFYADGTAVSYSDLSASKNLNIYSVLSSTYTFSPDRIVDGRQSTVAVRMYNSSSGPALLQGVSLNKTLPAGITLAPSPNARSTCGGSVSISATGGGSQIQMSGAEIPRSNYCYLYYDVQVDFPGAVNTYVTDGVDTGDLTAEGGDIVGSTSSDRIYRSAAPSDNLLVALATNPSSLTFPGQVSRLTATVTAGTTSITDLEVAINFTDDGTSSGTATGVVVAPSPQAVTDCDYGEITAAAGSNAISLSGGSLSSTQSCTIEVNVLSGDIGGKTITVPAQAISTSQGVTNSNLASTSIAVGSNIGVLKSFTPSVVSANQRSRLRITFFNPTSLPMSSLSVTDNLPTGLVVPPGASPTTTCSGGTLSAPDVNTVTLTGGTIAATPAGQPSTTCYAEIDVLASSVGTYVNTIPVAGASALVAGASSANSEPATATLLVTDPLLVHLGLDQGYSGTSYQTNDAVALPTGWSTGITTRTPSSYSSLKIIVDNPTNIDATNLGLRLDLPSGLLLYSTPSASNSCGGSLEAQANGSFLRLSGASLVSGAECYISARVVSNSVGSQLTPVVAASSITTFEGLSNAEPSSATLEVLQRPSVAMQFIPSVIAPNDTSRLTIAIGNQNSVDLYLSSSSTYYTNTLPDGVTVASTPNLASDCISYNNSYITAVAGSNEIKYYYYGARIPAGGCSISVDVTASNTGSYLNYLPAEWLRTSTAGNSINAASALLSVSTAGYISGRVFADNNTTPNSSFDIGVDTPLSAQTVSLYSGGDCSTSKLLDTTTNELGAYSFTGLASGTYSVCQAAQPTGTINGTAIAGSIDAVNGSTGAVGTASDPTTTSSQIISIVLNSDGASSEVSGSSNNNFVEIIPSSISGRVFVDANNNGLQNGSDYGLLGETIRLLASDGTTEVATTTTDSSGDYIFSALLPGDYYIEQPNQPTGTSNGKTVLGIVTNSGLAGSATATNVLPSTLGPITLPPNASATGFNFAEVLNNRIIFGLVFLDRDSNGLFNGSDAGIAGETINLTGTDANGNAVSKTATTDSSGSYVFSGLAEGTYTVTQPNQPTSTNNGETTAGSTGGTASATGVTPSTITGIDLTGINTISALNNFAELPDVAPDLVVDITTATGYFDVGTAAASFTISVANAGDADTNTTTTVVTTLPSGLTFNQASGVGWTCNDSGQVITCTTNTTIQFGNVAPVITISADVSLASHSNILTTTSVVSGGGEPATYVSSQNTDSVAVTIIGTGAVSGLVFTDVNRNEVHDTGEPVLPGYIVEIYDGSTLVQTSTTNSNGLYTFVGLLPGNYKLRFYTPSQQRIVGRGTVAKSSTYGMIDAVVTPGGVLVASPMPVPVDPSGVVYDSVTRQPLSGAVVTISGPTGFNAATDIIGGSATYTTGTDGRYEFWLTPVAPSGTYTLQVTTYPSGYLAAQSVTIPACINTPVALATPPTGYTDASVHALTTAPATSAAIHDPASCPLDSSGWGLSDTTYYQSFDITIGGANQSADIVNNHIPLDPEVTTAFLTLDKTASAKKVELGDSLGYTLNFNHESGAPQADVSITDTLPRGFKYIPNTARIQVSGSRSETITGDTAVGVTGVGPVLNFNLGALTENDQVIVTYRVRVGVGALQGDGINTAQASTSSGKLSNIAKAQVHVTEGVFTNEGCLIGKIYLDCNNNKMQDGPEEIGIPKVRFYLEDGQYVISDLEGKYSICNLPAVTHVIKVDPITLPKGAELTITSNRNAGVPDSLFIDMKFGEMYRAEFTEGSCNESVRQEVELRRANKTSEELRAPIIIKFGSEPSLRSAR